MTTDKEKGSTDKEAGSAEKETESTDKETGATGKEAGSVDKETGSTDKEAGSAEKESESTGKETGSIDKEKVSTDEETSNTKTVEVAEESRRVIEQVARQQKSDKDEEGSIELIQLVIFRLGTEEYALHIDQIKEVVLTPNIAKIPQTPNYIKGVANIRGNVIAILDLEEKFNLISQDVENDKETSNYTLVVESEKFKIGILVKEVPTTLAVNTSEIDSSSSIIQYSSLDENCINGIVKSGDRMIIMMDMIKMMESEELSSLSKSME